jgi:hypothetical protein
MVMGCDFGQGVLIAPPMPQQRFLDLLNQRVNKPRPRATPTPASDQPQGSEPATSLPPIDRVA